MHRQGCSPGCSANPSPLQVGVGLPSGCKAILHSVKNVHESPNIPADHRFTLLVDFCNAFNSVDWATMFHEVRSQIPTIAAWMECSYGCQPNLLLDDQIIPSCCGVQQGDPLGPLGFALVLHPIVENITESVPDLLTNVWYLDDGTLCGTQKDLAIIEAEGPPRGLLLNRGKSFIHTPANSSITHPYMYICNIPTSSDGFTLFMVFLFLSDVFVVVSFFSFYFFVCCLLLCFIYMGCCMYNYIILLYVHVYTYMYYTYVYYHKIRDIHVHVQ